METDDCDLQIVSVVSLHPDAIMASCSKQALAAAKAPNDMPLYKIIKSLVSVIDNESEKTVLTNSHIKDILEKELNIDLKSKLKMEVDIYINVLKKFLKSWPLWDDFDNLIKECKNKKDKNISVILNEQYKNLKTHLIETLKLAEKHMKPFVDDLIAKTAAHEPVEEDGKNTKEVVMDIVCSRAQLNKLIYTKPHPQTNSIFNITDGSASKISTKVFTLQEIINWPNVQVTLSLPGIECMRTNTSNIKVTLMNTRRDENMKRKKESHPLDMHRAYYNKSNIKIQEPDTQHVIEFVSEMVTHVKQNNHLSSTDKEMLCTVIEQFEKDFKRGPKQIRSGHYHIYLNSYKYVRYLYTDIEEDHPNAAYSDMDLQLEELLTPVQVFQIIKLVTLSYSKEQKRYTFTFNKGNFFKFPNWLKIECISCRKKFQVSESTDMLEVHQHFADYHQGEPDWQCTGCKETFTQTLLAENRWYHKCD